MESLLKNPRILLKLGKNWSINDIEELDIRLMDVGWDASGGKAAMFGEMLSSQKS